MDPYNILLQKSLEHPVIIEDEDVPLWKLSKDDIQRDNIDFNLPWSSLQDLALSLYELKKNQQGSKELIKFPIEEAIVGIAFLKSKKISSLLSNDSIAIETCLNHLNDLMIARIVCISRHYYLVKRPLNTNIFDDIILKFPPNKNIVVKNRDYIEEIVLKLKNFDF